MGDIPRVTVNEPDPSDPSHYDPNAHTIRAEIARLLALAPAAQGYLAVATERGPRSYLLGPRTQVDGSALPVLDRERLEFDAVVIPDLSPAFYPENPELGRALYVAATRARDWLWLLTPEAWSPLVCRDGARARTGVPPRRDGAREIE